MHILVALPLDTLVDKELVLSCVRKELGSCGHACTMFMLPEIQSGSIDSLFDAEERIRDLERLTQDAIKKHLSTYSELSSSRVTDHLVLNRSFDYFVKSFAWNEAKYPLTANITSLISSMEQEMGSLTEAYAKRHKQYAEELAAKETVEKKASGSMYDVDVNAAAYREEEEAISNFFKRYYIGVREKLKEKDVEALKHIDGLFIESRALVFRCIDGEIYEVLGRKDISDQITREIEGEGYCVKRYFRTREEYMGQHCEEEKCVCRFEEVKESMYKIVSSNAPKLYQILMHVNYLGLYIESILRFGTPATFGCFTVDFKYRAKILGKWKRVSKGWKYSRRVGAVEKELQYGENEVVYDFVYRIVEDFEVPGDKDQEKTEEIDQ